MKIEIELPGIKAISRNQTTGTYWTYREHLIQAEQWMWAFGRSKEHHFENMVDVLIEAFYITKGRSKISDAPNIDDKIFTDILNRYKPTKTGKIERKVWFIEDDNPKYLRYVTKRAIPADQYKVVITITEVPWEETVEGATFKLNMYGNIAAKK